MDHRGSVSTSLPELPSSMSDNAIYGDDELDEETVNFISALYTALGPLLPEVTKLQCHQDPPAHLMVDMKAKLRELGSSVSDARKRLLRYNIYLKRRLAKAVQARKALKEQQLRQQGEDGSEQSVAKPPSTALVQRGVKPEPVKASLGAEKIAPVTGSGGARKSGIEPLKMQEIPTELLRTKALERVHRRNMRLHDARNATAGEPSSALSTSGLQDAIEDRVRPFPSPAGVLQRNACKLDNITSLTNSDKSPQ